MSLLLPFLFTLGFGLVPTLALFILHKNPVSPLHRTFGWACLSLLAWLGTLYVFDRLDESGTLTFAGRLNYASVLFVVLLAYLFLRQVLRRPARNVPVLLGETLLLSALTLLTPLVDRMEQGGAGSHVTRFGPLFVLYVLHLLSYLGASLYQAFHMGHRASRQVRSQLAILGTGMLLSGSIAIVCDLVLPYAFHVFAWQEVGALSTLLFLASVAYAISTQRLFSARVLIRRTVVFTLLIAFALELYQGAVGALAELLPLGDPLQRHIAAASLALVVNALTQQPLKEWLERRVDRWLDGRHTDSRHETRSSGRPSSKPRPR